jgi:type I restriction enzyme S subunit
VASDPVDIRFFRYQLLSLRDKLVSRGAGSTFMELSTEGLATLPMTRPPSHEQRRIADFLDAETARIDSLQSTRTSQLVGLQELALSGISAIVPRRAEVAFVRLGYLATIQSGITVDSKRGLGADALTLPYLRVANVQDGRVDLGSISEITVPVSVARSATLRYGDVLMTEGGDLDKLGRGTVWLDEIKGCLHQNHVFAVRPDRRKLVPEYLALLTRTSYGRSYFESTGTKTTNLASTSSGKIRDFKVPLFEMTDQARIFREIDSWLQQIVKLEAVLERQRSLLDKRRKALITAAVTGQIDVTTARVGGGVGA